VVAPASNQQLTDRAACSPDQITRELDTYELMQLLDYGGGDTFDGALFSAAASQGADRCDA